MNNYNTQMTTPWFAKRGTWANRLYGNGKGHERKNERMKDEHETGLIDGLIHVTYERHQVNWKQGINERNT